MANSDQPSGARLSSSEGDKGSRAYSSYSNPYTGSNYDSYFYEGRRKRRKRVLIIAISIAAISIIGFLIIKL